MNSANRNLSDNNVALQLSSKQLQQVTEENYVIKQTSGNGERIQNRQAVEINELRHKVLEFESGMEMCCRKQRLDSANAYRELANEKSVCEAEVARLKKSLGQVTAECDSLKRVLEHLEKNTAHLMVHEPKDKHAEKDRHANERRIRESEDYCSELKEELNHVISVAKQRK